MACFIAISPSQPRTYCKFETVNYKLVQTPQSLTSLLPIITFYEQLIILTQLLAFLIAIPPSQPRTYCKFKTIRKSPVKLLFTV